ncbi:unnamed protein product [Phyllotreta striolata]|uniref:Protein transport protein Sec24B n=1 Tax=Phyllotreta striolata TaxID=444603 RepID=A0A9N9XRD9_PHYSR|nr:unnamed protein product [Phyllotreta striolata]
MTDRRPNGFPSLRQAPPIDQFNGAHSSQSSRSSSPNSRAIPASQLPPSRPPLALASPSKHPPGPLPTSAPIGPSNINSNPSGGSIEKFAPVVNDNSANINAQHLILDGNVRWKRATYDQYSNSEFGANPIENRSVGVAKSSNEIPARTASSYFGEAPAKQPLVDVQSTFNRNVPANPVRSSHGPYSNDTAQVIQPHVNSQLAKDEVVTKIPLNASVPSDPIGYRSQTSFNRNAPATMNSNRMPYGGVYSHSTNVTQQMGALKIDQNRARIDNSAPFYGNSANQIRPAYNQNVPQAPANVVRTTYDANRRPPLPQNSLNSPQIVPNSPQIVPNSPQNGPNLAYNQPPKVNLHSHRYPTPFGDHAPHHYEQQFDLLQQPNVLPPIKEPPPAIRLLDQTNVEANCSPDLFRCTITNVPESASLLQKSRLPFGLLIHPFRDLAHLPVIQCNVIVRCRACRTYINPFVTFSDAKRWKCNLCYRINELPEEFQYDPLTKTYGDPSRRPEIRSSTLEYIAPAEYMLRPPQPAVYLYLLDLSRAAAETGYLSTVCEVLLEELGGVPGDARTQIGFVGFDSALHFYSMSEGANQPHEMTVMDVDDAFIPTPDDLLVNLHDRQDLIVDLLRLLPRRFARTTNTSSCLGAALQAAYKLTASTGGRITVFAASLPDTGPGKLINRESTNGELTDASKLNPANDFYKKMALECSAQQIAVDLFVLGDRHVDLATISGVSRFTGGQIQRHPLLDGGGGVATRGNFARSFRRYVTRKIGFEAVMRVRCNRGLSVHSFHGNFFVRSTDLLSLPNVNPDSGFAMQITIDEALNDIRTACFQCALLYTSSKGERRIRVHTLCLPIVKSLTEVINSADQECVVGLLAKMAVDRSLTSGLMDAREAFINAVIDVLGAYKVSLNAGAAPSGLPAPDRLKLLPLYVMSLLKNRAFRNDRSIKLDERLCKMMEMKTKPLYMLMLEIYPDLYAIDDLYNQPVVSTDDGEEVNVPVRLQLTARCLRNDGIFLMDSGEKMLILVCPNASPDTLKQMFDVSNLKSLVSSSDVPELENDVNRRLRKFIDYLNEDRPFRAALEVIRDDSPNRGEFFERLVEDRGENALSYYEFLQHVKTQVK